ncbi:arsenate reductase ArsC [Bradyrhizobium ganzhouense]|uniref:arsenate reductase ArsC n=1 Tax=Bradyrhizobium ganzhouense TaxID=1179767 RepID=UPI003CF711FA
MPERIYNVLFLCTGNSARSILAESILRKDGAGRFCSFSAGSTPKGAVHPLALRVLERLNYPTDGMRSKSWIEFAKPDAPVMDFIFTVCDDAAGESCPIWPGQPTTAHWGIEDPADAQGTELEREAAFTTAFRYLKNRIGTFVSLPLDSIEVFKAPPLDNMDKRILATKLREIGDLPGATDRRPKAS